MNGLSFTIIGIVTVISLSMPLFIMAPKAPPMTVPELAIDTTCKNPVVLPAALSDSTVFLRIMNDSELSPVIKAINER